MATALLSLVSFGDRGNLSDHGGWAGLGRLARWLRLLGVTKALLRTPGQISATVIQEKANLHQFRRRLVSIPLPIGLATRLTMTSTRREITC